MAEGENFAKQLVVGLKGLDSGVVMAKTIVQYVQKKRIKKFLAAKGKSVASAPTALVPLVEAYYAINQMDAKVLSTAGMTPKGLAYGLNGV